MATPHMAMALNMARDRRVAFKAVISVGTFLFQHELVTNTLQFIESSRPSPRVFHDSAALLGRCSRLHQRPSYAAMHKFARVLFLPRTKEVGFFLFSLAG